MFRATDEIKRILSKLKANTYQEQDQRNLEALFPSYADLRNCLLDLRGQMEFTELLLNSLSPEFVARLVNSAEDFACLIMSLEAKVRILIYEKIKSHAPRIIRRGAEVGPILIHLPPKERADAFQAMKPKFSDVMHTDEDFIQLYQHLLDTEREAFLKSCPEVFTKIQWSSKAIARVLSDSRNDQERIAFLQAINKHISQFIWEKNHFAECVSTFKKQEGLQFFRQTFFNTLDQILNAAQIIVISRSLRIEITDSLLARLTKRLNSENELIDLCMILPDSDLKVFSKYYLLEFLPSESISNDLISQFISIVAQSPLDKCPKRKGLVLPANQDDIVKHITQFTEPRLNELKRREENYRQIAPGLIHSTSIYSDYAFVMNHGSLLAKLIYTLKNKVAIELLFQISNYESHLTRLHHDITATETSGTQQFDLTMRGVASDLRSSLRVLDDLLANNAPSNIPNLFITRLRSRSQEYHNTSFDFFNYPQLPGNQLYRSVFRSLFPNDTSFEYFKEERKELLNWSANTAPLPTRIISNVYEELNIDDMEDIIEPFIHGKTVTDYTTLLKSSDLLPRLEKNIVTLINLISNEQVDYLFQSLTTKEYEKLFLSKPITISEVLKKVNLEKCRTIFRGIAKHLGKIVFNIPNYLSLLAKLDTNKIQVVGEITLEKMTDKHPRKNELIQSFLRHMNNKSAFVPYNPGKNEFLDFAATYILKFRSLDRMTVNAEHSSVKQFPIPRDGDLTDQFMAIVNVSQNH